MNALDSSINWVINFGWNQMGFWKLSTQRIKETERRDRERGGETSDKETERHKKIREPQLLFRYLICIRLLRDIISFKYIFYFVVLCTFFFKVYDWRFQVVSQISLFYFLSNIFSAVRWWSWITGKVRWVQMYHQKILDSSLHKHSKVYGSSVHVVVATADPSRRPSYIFL